MADHQLTSEIFYTDGTRQKIVIAMGTVMDYESAFEKVFLRSASEVYAQAWITWRQCQKIDPDTPTLEEWAETVDWLYVVFPKPIEEHSSG